jgi:hypothetical protein
MMAKIKLLKYDPPYGGQSLKLNGIKKGFDFFNDFCNGFTIPVDETEMELIIHEEVSGKTNVYKSNEYIKLANKLFDSGNKSQWLNNINTGDKEYRYEWKINKLEYERCINFVDSIKPFPKYYIGPIEITISYWFKWKKYNYEKSLFVSDYFSKNHLMLYLSKTNSIIANFIFPFEAIETEFVDFYKNLKEKIPFDLSIKHFRHYNPTKDEMNYKINKLSLEEITIFEKLIK